MPALNHVHTYRRIKGDPKRYMCAHSECTHIMIKSALLGKKSLCNVCGSEYNLNHEHLKRAVPNCGCVKSGGVKPEVDLSTELEILESLNKVEE